MTTIQKTNSSCIIVNYNTSGYVIDCLNSLQHEPIDHKIVIDNNSTNDTPELIKKAHPDVQLIKLSKNVGFGAGCNVGIQWIMENTNSEFILFLNPDTIVEPGTVEKLKCELDDSLVGIAAPLITFLAEKNKLWYGGGSFSWLKGSARVPGFGHDIPLINNKNVRDVQFASGCAFMTKINVINQCGGFDENYFMYEEDAEFSLRILKKGFKIRFVPEAIVRHHVQGSQNFNGKTFLMLNAKNPNLTFFVYHTVRNRFITVFKHGTILNRLTFFAGFTVFFLIKSINWIRHSRMDAVKALLRGLTDFIKLKR